MSTRYRCPDGYKFRVIVATGADRVHACVDMLQQNRVFFIVRHNSVGPKKKSKAQKEAERLQAEEDERKAEILKARREAERVRKEAEDAKRLKEEQVCRIDPWIMHLCSGIRITCAVSIYLNLNPQFDSHG